MNLIDKNELIKAFDEKCVNECAVCRQHTKDGECGLIINSQVVAEVVDEIVEGLIQCKDCKYYDPSVHYCDLLKTNRVDDNFLCSDGKCFPGAES